MSVSSQSWDVLDFTEVLTSGEFAGMVVESASSLGSVFMRISWRSELLTVIIYGLGDARATSIC